ncbi:Similar to Kcnip3: Calsenilin (Mus musculus) [Cotesia congregata]|uniref:Similar to Kcnip3: Calsenilin (Mus musculus) n=1 Tax=Cotesia congregata TaxID=51543 RepID=A0A8J2HAF1_COTCN|nr:Similar to Kcnip3: Calsenilin (Mus musculus) [Cotesia congregata]
MMSNLIYTKRKPKVTFSSVSRNARRALFKKIHSKTFMQSFFHTEILAFMLTTYSKLSTLTAMGPSASGRIKKCNCCLVFQDLLVTLSTLLRGSIYEKLRWTFKLYDINGDGCITRGELGEVVTAVHELMGRKHPAEEERKAKEQLDRVFEKLDLNHDGVITIEEFIESCLRFTSHGSYIVTARLLDEVITRSLAMFDCDF